MRAKVIDINKYSQVAKAVNEAIINDPTASTATLGFIGSVAWGKKYDLVKDQKKCQAFFQYLRKVGIVDTKVEKDGSISKIVNNKWLMEKEEISSAISTENRKKEISNFKIETPEDLTNYIKLFTDNKEILDILKEKLDIFYQYKIKYDLLSKKLETLEKELENKVNKVIIENKEARFELNNVNVKQIKNIIKELENE